MPSPLLEAGPLIRILVKLPLVVLLTVNIGFPFAPPAPLPSSDMILDPIPATPFWLIINRGNPEEEAVKRSPTPELSTVKAAKEVLPDTDAVAWVPFTLRISRVPS